MTWHNAAPAQIANTTPEDGLARKIPLTPRERLRRYLKSTYGPEAFLRAAAGSGISQWTDTPKEWKQGWEAYGERFGNAFAKHTIDKTLESGAAAILHEDNRYYRLGEAGMWKRTRHAIGSAFVARNDAGGEHFAYSRFGGALGGGIHFPHLATAQHQRPRRSRRELWSSPWRMRSAGMFL